MTKATAVAYTIQGIVKYHGIRDWAQMLPFHDSISACMSALSTVTTVAIEPELKHDVITIDGRGATLQQQARVKAVLDAIRSIAGSEERVRAHSKNTPVRGKGLGFSASAFASLGLAACEAFGLRLSRNKLSEIVRLGSGSATRSLVGGFAIWYAERDGRSYAECLAKAGEIPLGTAIVPIPLSVTTWEVHRDSVTSPLFEARLGYVRKALREAREAIRAKDVKRICQVAERDTLNLHAISMTGERGMILWEPETIRVIREVLRMRSEGVPAWFSIDTGPSVFVNAPLDSVREVAERLRSAGFEVMESRVGEKAVLVERHLF